MIKGVIICHYFQLFSVIFIIPRIILRTIKNNENNYSNHRFESNVSPILGIELDRHFSSRMFDKIKAHWSLKQSIGYWSESCNVFFHSSWTWLTNWVTMQTAWHYFFWLTLLPLQIFRTHNNKYPLLLETLLWWGSIPVEIFVSPSACLLLLFKSRMIKLKFSRSYAVVATRVLTYCSS